MSLTQDFFKIRTPVPFGQKVILGIIPILVLLFLWFLMTLGRTETVLLPDGVIEPENIPPAIGQTVPYSTRLVIQKTSDWQFAYDEDLGKNFLVHGEHRLPVPFGCTERSGIIRIGLKRGTFVGRRLLQLNTNVAIDPASATPPIITRGGELAPTAPAVATPPAVVEFRYEVIESRLFNPSILPSPMETIRGLKSIFTERKLASNLFSSLLRVIEGFLVAIVIVFPLGILMGAYRKIHALFSPLMVFGGYLPIPALVPLTMSLFGVNEWQKVMFLALAFGIYLLPLFVKTIEEIDNVYLLTAYTLGASQFQTVRRVLLAIAAPNLYDSMRMGFGIGWGYIILAEMVDLGSGGVGAMILVSQRRALPADIYLVLLSIVILAFVTDKIWEFVGDRLFPYRRLKR